jgi:ABC-2 type transport system ATP-binding protein
MGAIVEQPKFYPGYSAKFNLELFANAIHAPKGKVDQVLEQVGLAGRSGDRFSTYSLGMKQRLAIAATLLKDPEVLIFDEPTNGLDPAGIHEIRESIRALGAAGHTVLVSSHILSEVEQMADTVTIIARGHTLAEGSVAEITGADRDGYRIELANPDDASAALVAAGFESRVVDGVIHVVHVPDPALVTKTLVEHGHYPTGITPMKRGLEQVFLELTDGVSVGEMGEDTPAAALRGGIR